MKPKHRRLIYVLFAMVAIGCAAALVLTAFKDNLQFFFSPTDIKNNPPVAGQTIRLGGMVQAGSIKKDQDKLIVKFRLTDFENSIDVEYRGVLPDLFREDSGAVAIGKIGADGVFAAQSILAKHDENYMPPEVAKSLKKPQPSGAR